MKQIVSRHRGMTLIEVMIALMVFAIGVLGVLNALTRSIGQSAKTKTNLQAQILAQEGLELVFAARNSNLVGYRERDCLDTITFGGQTYGGDSIQLCENTMASISGSFLGISFDPFAGIYGVIKPQGSGFQSNWELFRLDQRRHPSLNTQWLGYTGGVLINPSSFARTVSFVSLTGLWNSGLVLTTVSVLINDAVYTDTRTLQSVLGPRE